MSAKQSDSRPLYEQVADDLRKRIERGELRGGDAVPSESELSEQHGVSRQTVRLALKNLTQEGLIVGGQGRTRTVRTWNPIEWRLHNFESAQRHADAIKTDPASDQWATDVKAQGHTPRQEVEVSIVVPPERVAQRLAIDPSTSVVVRRRVRYVDETPFQLADSYFPEHLVKDTLLMEPRDVTAPGGVLRSIGLVQASYRDEIRVRMPARHEAATLGMSPGTPVAEHFRTGYDSDGRPLRVMVTTVPGDRYVLVYEIDAA